MENIIEQQMEPAIEAKMKCCKTCNVEQPITNFHKNGTTHHPSCKPCRQTERKSVRYERKEGTKNCPDCGEEISTDNFNSDSSQPDGLQTYCRPHAIVRQRSRLSKYDGFIKNNFKDIRSNAKRRNITVNITTKDINDLFKKQNGLCAISKIKMTHICTERKNNDQHILNKWNISVDRIDSTKGYEKDNIQLVCAIINRLKFNLSTDDFLLIITAITQHNTNAISRSILKDVNSKYMDQINDTKTDSFVVFLLDEIDKTKIIKMNTNMQKYACSFDGYTNKLYLDAKQNNKKRAKDLDFTITEKDIRELYKKQDGKCNLSGKKMTHIGYQDSNKQKINNWNISVDRIDSTKGYMKDNVQLVCAIINRMKSDLNDAEFFGLCDDVHRNNFDNINKVIQNCVSVH